MYKQILYVVIVILAAIGVGIGLYLLVPSSDADKIGETTMVKVFFSNKFEDPEALYCEAVYFSQREVSKDKSLPVAALEELLKGPTKIEKEGGFFTNINPGVKVQGLDIEKGVAKVDFDEMMQKGVAGSCRVIAIRSQITETLKQFPEIKEVVISVNGNSEEALQP